METEHAKAVAVDPRRVRLEQMALDGDPVIAYAAKAALAQMTAATE
jgi:hypothetical protein